MSIFILEKISFHQEPINFGSRSLMIADGIPQSWPIRPVIKAFAQEAAFQSSAPGTSRFCFVDLHVTVNRASQPLHSGSATIKSIATV